MLLEKLQHVSGVDVRIRAEALDQGEPDLVHLDLDGWGREGIKGRARHDGTLGVHGRHDSMVMINLRGESYWQSLGMFPPAS